MILLLWLGRLLDRVTWWSSRIADLSSRAADAVYRVPFGRENRRAKRESEQRANVRVGSPLHRDR